MSPRGSQGPRCIRAATDWVTSCGRDGDQDPCGLKCGRGWRADVPEVGQRRRISGDGGRVPDASGSICSGDDPHLVQQLQVESPPGQASNDPTPSSSKICLLLQGLPGGGVMGITLQCSSLMVALTSDPPPGRWRCSWLQFFWVEAVPAASTWPFPA